MASKSKRTTLHLNRPLTEKELRFFTQHCQDLGAYSVTQSFSTIIVDGLHLVERELPDFLTGGILVGHPISDHASSAHAV